MFKLLFRYITRQQIFLIICSAFTIAIQVVLSLKIPDYMAGITVLVKTPGSQLSEIINDGVWMLVCTLGSALSAVAAGYFSTKLASLFSSRLRQTIFDHVEDFSLAEIDRFSTASLITRSTNDVTQIQNFMSRGLRMMIRMPLMAGWALYKISTRFWQWTVLVAATVAVVCGVVVFMIIYAHPKLRKRQAMTDELSRTLRENLTGIRVIRAYNATGYQQDKFDKANEALTSNELKAHRAMSLMRPTIKFANNALMVGIYMIGAMLISSATTAEQLGIFADMVVFSSYAAKLLQSFMDLNMVFNQYPRADVSAQRIWEVLKTPASINPGEKTSEHSNGADLIFEHVNFRYPAAQKDVLQDISFEAKPGQTVAFIGATGSGKTTVANLIPRLYDVTGGRILFNGSDIRDYQLTQLRDEIGYATQKALLFSGTVYSNVSYGDNGRKEPTEAMVDQAVRIAQAEDFVKSMPKGINSTVNRGGTNISGGQKQRLSIARAICRQPGLYIFDDSFSALDYQTDRQLRQALKEKTAGVTTILIAQRIGTIRQADKIIVLNQGRIVGQGKHEELMKNCELYQQIAKTQLSAEELA